MNCLNCLCNVCNKVRCPKGRYHCMPCLSGVVLDCDFFIHKRVTKIYRIKREGGDALVLDKGSLKASLEAENQRHRKALRDIVKLYKSRE